MSEIELIVGGFRYAGWKGVRITRSIENLSGKFELDVSERWGAQDEPWAIAEEDPCRVEIDGIPVIDGYIDARNPSGSKESLALSYSGRDRAAALIDNSLVLSQWTFRNLTLFEFATTVAEQWAVPVSLQAGLVLKTRDKIVVQPGDKAYEVLAREAAEDGVLFVSDGRGGIVITRSGKTRATSLIEGENIYSGSGAYDGAERYYRYVIATQSAGTDEACGEATRVFAEAFDEGVLRKDRVLFIRPEKSYNQADARRRADWEARIRAARAETVTLTVLGWKQPNGTLWPLNALTRVKAQRLAGVDGDMLISQVDHSIAEAGEITQLRLVRPDAFTPEPQTAKVKAAGGLWKELDRGGL